MPDATVDILIKTKAELEAANKAKSSIEGVNNATKGTKAASEEAGKAGDKLSEGLKEQSKHSEFLGLNHRGLHKVVHKLAEAFPLAGQAARAMMNPILFAFTAAIGVFTMAKEKIEEYNNVLDEAGAKAAERANHFGLLKEAMAGNAQAAALLADHLRHLGDDTTSLTDKTNRYIASIHAEAAAQAEIRNAQEGVAQARINELEALGKITAAQAAAARMATTDIYAKAAIAAKQREETDAIRIHTDALKKAQEAQAGLNAAATAAGNNAHDVQRTIRINVAGQEKTASEEAVKKAQAERDKDLDHAAAVQDYYQRQKAHAEANPDNQQIQAGFKATTRAQEKAQDELAKAEQELKFQKDKQAEAYKTEDRLKLEQQQAEADAKRAQEKADQNSDSAKSESKALEDAKAEQERNNRVRAAQASAASATGIAEAGLSGTSANVTPDQYGKLLAEHQKTHALVGQYEQMLKDALKLTGENAAERVGYLAQLIAGLKASDTKQEAKIQAIISKINNGRTNSPP